MLGHPSPDAPPMDVANIHLVTELGSSASGALRALRRALLPLAQAFAIIIGNFNFGFPSEWRMGADSCAICHSHSPEAERYLSASVDYSEVLANAHHRRQCRGGGAAPICPPRPHNRNSDIHSLVSDGCDVKYLVPVTSIWPLSNGGTIHAAAAGGQTADDTGSTCTTTRRLATLSHRHTLCGCAAFRRSRGGRRRWLCTIAGRPLFHEFRGLPALHAWRDRSSARLRPPCADGSRRRAAYVRPNQYDYATHPTLCARARRHPVCCMGAEW